jgi:hypothetical protein
VIEAHHGDGKEMMTTDSRQLEDARSIADSFRRMEGEACAAAESMEGRIAFEILDGDTDVGLLRQNLERTQIFSVEISRSRDAYEQRYQDH